MDISFLANNSFYGITYLDYLIAIGIVILALIVLRVFKFFVVFNLEKLSKKTKTQFDDVLIGAINNISWFFYIIFSFYLGLRYLNILPIVNKVLDIVMLIAVLYYAVRLLQDIIEFAFDILVFKKDSSNNSGIMSFLKTFLKLVLWVIAVLLLLANLGYNISALIAGLGIGGLAIGLALQNVFSDLFASISIYFDKPFKVGDFIIIGSDMGVVKKIGIKTTRINTLQGQELVISNTELTNARVNNYGKMKKRRIGFSFGVTHSTPKKKLEKIPGIVHKIIKSVKDTTFDRAHFSKFDDSSLLYEVVYYVETGDYNKYMDIQQEINLKIVDAFEKEKIEMAFPTRTIYMKK